MNSFDYYMPPRIHYGSGSLNKLSEIVSRYGNRCIIIGPEMNQFIRPIYERAEKILSSEGINFKCFYEVEPNPSTKTVLKAKKIAEEYNIDLIVAIGGGSTIDTSKMVASLYGNQNVDFTQLFKTNDYPFGIYPPIGPNPKPYVAISTTSGTGSQCTQAAVITDDVSHQKLTVFHQNHFAKEVIVDPELMLSLPKGLTASTAFDAFTHAFESYLNHRLAPHTMFMSEYAIKTIFNYLPKVLKENKIEYREELAYADTLAGQCLANGGAHLPHPISEVIGSSITSINHGQALAIVYPYFMDYHWKNEIDKYAFIARALDSSYESKTNEEAASQASKLLQQFLIDVGLDIDLVAHGLNDDLKKEIMNCPIWEHLPMAPTEDILAIVEKILNKEKLTIRSQYEKVKNLKD